MIKQRLLANYEDKALKTPSCTQLLVSLRLLFCIKKNARLKARALFIIIKVIRNQDQGRNTIQAYL